MGLFSSKPRPEPRSQPQFTIHGTQQTQPEGPGTIQRRWRLFQACVAALRDDPLASPNAELTPIGDGLGLEGLVARIKPVFTGEASMIAWTALRGALGNMYVHTWDTETLSLPFYPVVERSMGVGLLSDPAGPEQAYGVAPEWDSQITSGQRENVLGIYHVVHARVSDYERYSTMDAVDVLCDAKTRISDAIALDVIAWTAVALLRLGLTSDDVPMPDRLDAAGWYTEPLWAKAERYWDGKDWTDRCRAEMGRQYREWQAPLRLARTE